MEKDLGYKAFENNKDQAWLLNSVLKSNKSDHVKIKFWDEHNDEYVLPYASVLLQKFKQYRSELFE